MASEAQLQQDLQAAMRAREMQKVYVLRGLVAAIKNLKVEKLAHELPDADISSLVRKEINKRVEAIGYAEKAGRAEIVEQNRAEKAILESYLPAQLGSAELEATIKSLAGELGTTQIGPLMAELRKRHAGQFDGKLASELIKKLAE
jgi:hypothetical protein